MVSHDAKEREGAGVSVSVIMMSFAYNSLDVFPNIVEPLNADTFGTSEKCSD